MSQFEQLGFFKEYYIDNKFIGTCKCERDREIIGYLGRKIEITSGITYLDQRKTIRPATKVQTIIYPLCGKIIKTN